MTDKIKTDKAPQAIGAYSQGIVADKFVFTSGQIGINPSTGELITENFGDEVRQVLMTLEFL